MARYSFLALNVITFMMVGGCALDTPPSSGKNDWFHYENKEISYSIDVPVSSLNSWKGKLPIDGPDTGFATYPVLTEPQEDDYSIIVRSPTGPCGPSLTGASRMEFLPIVGGEAEWGRSDLNELMKQEGYMPPYETDKVICGGAPNVYAFCSEHDGKTVVICLNQVTDNPTLAEEIFKTFKWTK